MPRQSTPLDEKHRELARLEAELNDRIKNLQSLIQEAPRRKQEQIERRKRALVERAERMGSRQGLDMPTSLRGGYTYRARTAVGGPALRSEQKAQRLQFLTLLVVLGVLTIFLLAKLGSL